MDGVAKQALHPGTVNGGVRGGSASKIVSNSAAAQGRLSVLL